MMSHKILPFQHKGRFYNYKDEPLHRVIIPSFCMLLECYWKSIKKYDSNYQHWCAPEAPITSSWQPVITWIGHATFLMQLAGINIVTDPVFGHLPLFKRLQPNGIEMEHLPCIDYVLISHNHRDHMDEVSLRMIAQKNSQVQFLVPQGLKKWFDKTKIARVHEYMWWDTLHVGEVQFTFLPAHHWSQRGLFDFNTSLWGSWMIQGLNQTIYFAGDTAYSHHFKAIAQEFPSISHALLPIGPCEPRRWMRHAHMSAEEAGQAFLDLKAQTLVPMHWGTFRFGVDRYQAPYERLCTWWLNEPLCAQKSLMALKMGQQKELHHKDLIKRAAKELTF